ncbi:MAG TPA: DUF547 domain-containing protein [Verrucomicrobiae bacterium]|nr:DUF547 domain-containing protein [Verrucomicrobiae bacterium]
MRAFPFLIGLLILISPAASADRLTKPFDHSAWDELLKKFVSPEGSVNYEGIKADPTLLNTYLNSVAALNSKEFTEFWPREEKLALILNLYHAAIMKHVIEHYPIKSLQDIPGVWDIPVVHLGKFRLSINQLRDTYLIQTFRDEKIEAALSCGAKSCPRLQREAFTGPRVEGQLYLAARNFVNDSSLNIVVPGKKEIKLSRIFKWYAGNFRLDFGNPEIQEKFSIEENAVLAFLAYYSDSPEKVQYLEGRNYKIKYLPFDWSLNDWRTEE